MALGAFVNEEGMVVDQLITSVQVHEARDVLPGVVVY